MVPDMPAATTRAVLSLTASLGVDDVYYLALAAEDAMREGHAELTACRHDTREVEDAILDREWALATEHRPNYPSQSAFDKAFKVILGQDDEWRELRSKLRSLQTKRELAEDKVREAEYSHRTSTARMTELNGLLTFYASVRETQQQESE